MHLNKSPSIISYTPPENNANGFVVGANSRPDINTGTLSAGDEVSSRTFKDEIIIAGEVYKNSELEEFLGDTKKLLLMHQYQFCIQTDMRRMNIQV